MLAGCLPSYFEKLMGSQGAETDIQNRCLSRSICRIHCLPVTREVLQAMLAASDLLTERLNTRFVISGSIALFLLQ